MARLSSVRVLNNADNFKDLFPGAFTGTAVSRRDNNVYVFTYQIAGDNRYQLS